MSVIGKTVRNLRQKKGWSLSELARNAGISKSLVSQIERDEANPSVGSLQAIASALDVPAFTLLLEENGAHDALVRKDQRLTLAIPGSEAVRQILTQNLQGAMSVLLCTIPPGTRSSPTAVNHEGEEWLFVLRGAVVVHLQHESHALDTGDFLYFDSRLAHYFENKGEEEAEIICSISPSILHM